MAAATCRTTGITTDGGHTHLIEDLDIDQIIPFSLPTWAQGTTPVFIQPCTCYNGIEQGLILFEN